jgi:hypothetical protein
VVGNVTYGTGFAQAGFTYDANISPFNQGFSLAVQAVIARTPVNAGTSFVNIVVSGTATVATLQVTTATIATVNISTATVTQLVVGTGTFSQLTASGTSTFGAIDVTGTASIAVLVLNGVSMTATSGTFTATFQNVSNVVTIPCSYTRFGNIVAITLNPANSTVVGTSNSTSFSLAPLPAAIVPAGNCSGPISFLEDNGAQTAGAYLIAGTSTVNFYKGTSGQLASWTGAGQKGVNGANTFSYNLN